MTENNFKINSAAVSDRGLSKKRPQNEDSFLEMRNLGLFAVADGVGGAQAGDVASQMAMEILGEAFVNLQPNGDAEEMMKIAIERANSAIYQMSSDLPQLATMATTIVALQLSGNIATIGHVGDSRLYRLDAKGSLYRETQDHSVVEEEVRAGRMTAAQAANHPSRNVISRALGAENVVEVDMKTIMFDLKTTFLLCSDGITRHINDFEIRELLLSRANPADICNKMKEICYSRGAEDNLTAVIVSVTGVGEGEYIKPEAAAPIIDEEATVATARPETIPQTFSEIQDAYEDIPTRGLEIPASMQTPEANNFTSPAEIPNYSNDDDEAYLMDEPNNETPQTAPQTQESSNIADYSINAVSETPAVSQQVTVTPKKDIIEAKPKSGGGFFVKLLSSLLLLFIGAILGVAGYYVWQQYFVTLPEKPTLVQETNNIPKSSSDKLNRDVDTNAKDVIKQFENETSLPQDAIDFYLLGRAYLLTKSYTKAVDAFKDARKRLKDITDPEIKAVLTTNIAQGMVIAQNDEVRKNFVKELTEPNTTVTNNQTNNNSEVNSSVKPSAGAGDESNKKSNTNAESNSTSPRGVSTNDQ